MQLDQSSRVPSIDRSSLTARAKLLYWLTADSQPTLTSTSLIIVLLVLCVVSLVLGVLSLTASNSVVEVSAQYSCQGKLDCSVSLPAPPADMVPPIFFYYRLTEYGQNSRRYVMSRSDAQLQGEELVSADAIDECSPREYGYSGDHVQYPCGLVAFTFFNDQFNITSSKKGLFSGDDWDGSSITWPTDPGNLFVERGVKSSETRFIRRDDSKLLLPHLDDQSLMVWMRPAALRDFRKLYRVIRTSTISAGEVITVKISEMFHSGSNGSKHVVLSTASWLGGRNTFIGSIYIFCACSLLVSAIGIWVLEHYVPPKPRRHV